jgi:hypothetical protein
MLILRRSIIEFGAGNEEFGIVDTVVPVVFSLGVIVVSFVDWQ